MKLPTSQKDNMYDGNVSHCLFCPPVSLIGNMRYNVITFDGLLLLTQFLLPLLCYFVYTNQNKFAHGEEIFIRFWNLKIKDKPVSVSQKIMQFYLLNLKDIIKKIYFVCYSILYRMVVELSNLHLHYGSLIRNNQEKQTFVCYHCNLW